MGSDFLFAEPTLLNGMARTLDLFGTFDSYNTSQTPTEADLKAIAADWKTIGADWHKAVEAVLADLKQNQPEVFEEILRRLAA